MSFRIPDDLLALVRERRVIPFVGAGFSAGLGLPGWAGLLEQVAKDLRISETDPKLEFDDISEDASEDFLRVAEYLYLRAGSNIGPLRLSISHALTISDSLTVSTPHLELLNLGAPQVYTTNFDDAIEATFRELNQPMEVVSLPRDVAVADPSQTQIVKYHGDLRYDDTLVLTESQYWRRLDLESPMDLKFRSDLLGRSVLFMGYSFSDINIRVIWFKLMRMMEDVPESDRKPSYIVRFEANPVLEALYHNVGLRTIVLDPKGDADSDEQRTHLLGEFLSSLASAASAEGAIPGNPNQKMFASIGLIENAEAEVARLTGQGVPWLSSSSALAGLYQRAIPGGLRDRAYSIVEGLATGESLAIVQIGELLSWAVESWGPRPAIAALTLRGFLHSGMRDELHQVDLPWKRLWGLDIPPDSVRPILRIAENEVRGHESLGFFDDDLAFSVDALKRLENGMGPEELHGVISDLLDRAATLYPAVRTYEPSPNGPPNPESIMKEIAVRAKAAQESDAPDFS
jgi:hypothetical protein